MNKAAKFLVSGVQGGLSLAIQKEARRLGLEVSAFSMRNLSVDELTKLLEKEKPTHLIHTAGVTRGSSDEDFVLNIELTRLLVEATSRLPIEKRPVIVSCGSASEVGNPLTSSVPDDAPLAPLSPYGRSKAGQCRLLMEARSYYGQRILNARVFNVSFFESGHATMIQGWWNRIAAASATEMTDFPTGNLLLLRDFLSGAWIARLLAVVALNPKVEGIVNVASGRPVSLGDVLRQLIAKSDKEFHLIHNPTFDRADTPCQVVAKIDKLRAALDASTLKAFDEASLPDLLGIQSL